MMATLLLALLLMEGVTAVFTGVPARPARDCTQAVLLPHYWLCLSELVPSLPTARPIKTDDDEQAEGAAGSNKPLRAIFVAPDGDDSATGASPSTAVATCAAAVRRIGECSKLNGGIEVVFAAGLYRLTTATACGNVTCKGSAENPIVFRSDGGIVTFDAAAVLDTSGMRPVSNDTVRALLNPKAWAAVRRRYFERVSALGHGHYTPEAAGLISGLRTGQALVLNFTRPCPRVPPRRDCHAVWLAWGECESSGTQTLRYTIEVDASGGGGACPLLDGTTRRVPCLR
eukprot:COSAG02_NODE_1481_length_12389_cov_15.643857_6_plen_286_part_00